ncbi:unnamed protein product, partial [Candidula unifasciata]
MYRRSLDPLIQVTMFKVLVIVLLELSLSYSTGAAAEEAYVTMARCRIQCLKQ